MKKLITLSLLLLVVGNTSAQREVFIPPQSEVFFRAKALGMVIIEDWWVRGLSIGGEYRIAHQFGFSADYVNFRQRYEEEVHDVPDQPDYYNEYSQYDARNYWAFQLKWYPYAYFDLWGVQPYVSVLAKVGGRKLYNQDKYPLQDGKTLVGISGDFYDLGVAFGVLTSGPWGADISLGFRQRTEHRWEETYHEDMPSTFQEINEVKYNAVLRVNGYIKLYDWREM